MEEKKKESGEEKKSNNNPEKQDNIKSAKNRADEATGKAERIGLVSVARMVVKTLNGLKSGVAMANDGFWSWRNNKMTKKLESRLGEREETMEKLRPLLFRLSEIERKKNELTQYVKKLEKEGSMRLMHEEGVLMNEKFDLEKNFENNKQSIQESLAEERLDAPMGETFKKAVGEHIGMQERYQSLVTEIERSEQAHKDFLKSEPVRVEGEKDMLDSEREKIGKRKDKKKWEGEIGAYDEVIGKIEAKKGKIWDNMSERGRKGLEKKLAKKEDSLYKKSDKLSEKDAFEKYTKIQNLKVGAEDEDRGMGIWSRLKSAWFQARGSKDQVRNENGLGGHQNEEALNDLYESSVPAEKQQENGADFFSNIPVFDDEKVISWKTELNSEDANVVAKKIKETIEKAMKGTEEEQKKKLRAILNWLEEKLKEANNQVSDNSEKRKEIFQEAIGIVENLEIQI